MAEILDFSGLSCRVSHPFRFACSACSGGAGRPRAPARRVRRWVQVASHLYCCLLRLSLSVCAHLLCAFRCSVPCRPPLSVDAFCFSPRVQRGWRLAAGGVALLISAALFFLRVALLYLFSCAGQAMFCLPFVMCSGAA